MGEQGNLTPDADGALSRGAGDSVRARAGSTVDAAPLAVGIGACLALGDVMICDLADGLMEPPAGAGRGWMIGLRGGNDDVAGDA